MVPVSHNDATASDIRLIATDLDGTLIGRANEFPLYDAFREKLETLRAVNGTRWAACTGRTFRSFIEFFSPMQAMGIEPDFVIVRHAYVFRKGRFGYVPDLFWNLHIFHVIWRHRAYAREALRRWRGMIMNVVTDVKAVERGRDDLRLQFESQESAQVAARLLGERLAPYKHLRVFQHLREVDVRPVPFTKGLSLRELSRHLGIKAENVLAIGNGHNDISMFDADVARYAGCPANSEAEVMEMVSRRGGHVASERSLTGVVEILDAFMNNSVSSGLPDTWNPSEARSRFWRRRARRQHRHHRRRMETRSFVLVVAMAYAVLVVFCHFGIIPYGHIILKPYGWLASGVEKLFEFLYR